MGLSRKAPGMWEIGSIRNGQSRPSFAARARIVSGSTSGGKTPPLSLKTRPPALAERCCHLCHCLRGADLTPGIKGWLTAAARVGKDDRVIGHVTEKEVGCELDVLAHRSPEQFAKPSARSLPAGIEAGQLDARVATRAQRHQASGE